MTHPNPPTETPSSLRALAEYHEGRVRGGMIRTHAWLKVAEKHAGELRARADELERGRPREQPQITAGSRVRVKQDADYEFGGREGAVNRIEAHRSKTGFIVQFTPYRCMWFTADELELLPEQPLHCERDALRHRCERLETALRKIMPAMEYARAWDEDADVPWDDPGDAAAFALATAREALASLPTPPSSTPPASEPDLSPGQAAQAAYGKSSSAHLESEIAAIRETAQREGWEQSEHYLRSPDRGFVVEVEVRPETP